jgi:hypothetical protein
MSAFIFNELLTKNVKASIVSDLSQFEHLKKYMELTGL